jgi:hypothetical protein
LFCALKRSLGFFHRRLATCADLCRSSFFLLALLFPPLPFVLDATCFACLFFCGFGRLRCLFLYPAGFFARRAY